MSSPVNVPNLSKFWLIQLNQQVWIKKGLDDMLMMHFSGSLKWNDMTIYPVPAIPSHNDSKMLSTSPVVFEKPREFPRMFRGTRGTQLLQHFLWQVLWPFGGRRSQTGDGWDCDKLVLKTSLKWARWAPGKPGVNGVGIYTPRKVGL